MTPTEELYDAYSRLSVGFFLDSVVIDSSPEPQRFGDIADPWQRELVAPKIQALDGFAGLADYSGPLSFLSVLARGHDKSSLEGRLLSWALVYSQKPVNGYLIAADLDQAALITEAMKREAELNPWYGDRLNFKRNLVTGPSGTVKVLPADAASAYGLRGNLYVCDEVTHWKKQDMWTAIVSGREKKPGSLLIVISNAGILGSWQDQYIRQVALRNPQEWRIFERQGNLASWMTEERRALLRQQLPELEAARLLDNIWVDASLASGFLVPADIEACEDPTIPAVPVRNPRYQYIAAADYGRVKDRTALVLLHEDENKQIVADQVLVYTPEPGRPVPVSMVDQWLDRVWDEFRPRKIIVDPYQLEGTIQRLETKGRPIERWSTRGGGGNMDLAMCLRGLIANRNIRWRDRETTQELRGLVTKLTSYGFRFDHTSGTHDDRAVAMAMAAFYASKFPAFKEPVLQRNPKPKLDTTNPLMRPYGHPVLSGRHHSPDSDSEDSY